ncbi:hypothetical protein ACI65C_006148 [Semiaphis heraclei]
MRLRVYGENIYAEDIGVKVTIRETRDGCPLTELAKRGLNLARLSETLHRLFLRNKGALLEKTSNLVSRSRWRSSILDAVSSAAEALESLRSVIPGGDDPTAAAEREAICDVQNWPVRAGKQVATAKMSRHDLI